MNPATNAPASPTNKPLWAAIAVLGIAVLAMGAALIRTQNPLPEPRMAVLPTASASSENAAATSPSGFATKPEDATQAVMVSNPPTAVVPTGPAAKAKSFPTNQPLAQMASVSTATKSGVTTVGEPTSGPRVVLPQNPEPAVARATAPSRLICANCATVESVNAVEVDGTGSGAGAIAGGVLGAVVGNQVGGGNGKSLATILGAVGGGMAGNEVEKKMTQVTQFDVTVRMDDGSRRTLRQATSPAVGSAVVVDGDSLQPARQ